MVVNIMIVIINIIIMIIIVTSSQFPLEQWILANVVVAW